MSGLVDKVFKEYLSKQTGQLHTLTRLSRKQLTSGDATRSFKATLKGSQWENVRGFHVFRHSFASNAAAEGIDQRMIDEWMGHQTEEMRRRYRHLAPSQQQTAIDAVFQNDCQTG